MKAETSRPSLLFRLSTCVFLGSLFLATTGCGGCGGSSPADKLAKFNLSRAPDPEEEQAPKKAPEKKPKNEADKQPAPTNKPAGTNKSVPKPDTQTKSEDEEDSPSPETTPDTAAAESMPPIPGAKERYVLLEAMKLQPVSGDREQTKARSEAILELVGQAIAQKIEDAEEIFTSDPVHHDEPLLSWRVHLLPYLGYDELYRQFKLDQPWDSRHNRALISQMPYAYTTPGLKDDRTNLVLLHGAACAVKDREPNPVDSLAARGLENSIVAVEVADPKSRVIWTAPTDLKFSSSRPANGIRGWSDDRFLAITADGKVHDWPVLKTTELNQLFAVNNSFDVSTLDAEAAPANAMMANASAEPSLTTPVASRTPLEPIAGNPAATEPALAPLPSGQAIEAAKLELRRLFQNEIREASNDAQKSELASKLLQQIEYLQEDPARHSAALLLAFRFAELSKNPLLAKESLDKLTERYAFDSLSHSLDVLRLAAENPGRVPSRRMNEFQLMAKTTFDQSLDDHNFVAAEEVIRISSTIATSQQDRNTLNRLAMLKEQIKLTRKEFDAIQARYLSLDTPSLDLAGNTQVGKYWCLYRDNWEKGFQFFRHSDQENLQTLAEAEISRPIDPKAKFQIAEGWWELAQKAPAGLERTRFMGRAARWYKVADDEMTQSIEKVTAQQRLAEFTRLTGVSEIPSI